MSYINFKVTPVSGEPYEVAAESRDIYTWEKTSKGKSFGESMRNGSVVDLTEIAYFASRRQGYFTGTLQEFATSHDIANAEGEEEPDPTQPTP